MWVRFKVALCLDKTCRLMIVQMWPAIAPGVRAFTKAAGYPMTLRLRNATVYTRLKGQPLAIISTEPGAASSSIIVQGQDEASRNSSGLGGGAIAGLVAGVIAGILELAALVAFGFQWPHRKRVPATTAPAGRHHGYTKSVTGATLPAYTQPVSWQARWHMCFTDCLETLSC